MGQDETVSEIARELLVRSGVMTEPEVAAMSRDLQRLSVLSNQAPSSVTDLRDVRARLFGYGRVGHRV